MARRNTNRGSRTVSASRQKLGNRNVRVRAMNVKPYSVKPLFFALLLMSIVLVQPIFKLYKSNKALAYQQRALQAGINKEEQRNKELYDYNNYMKTDEYIKDIAKTELGMIEDGDEVFKSGEK